MLIVFGVTQCATVDVSRAADSLTVPFSFVFLADGEEHHVGEPRRDGAHFGQHGAASAAVRAERELFMPGFRWEPGDVWKLGGR